MISPEKSAANALIGVEGPTVYWWCTVCKVTGETRHPGAEGLEYGRALPMGQAFACTGCKRRNTCNFRLPRDKVRGHAK